MRPARRFWVRCFRFMLVPFRCRFASHKIIALEHVGQVTRPRNVKTVEQKVSAFLIKERILDALFHAALLLKRQRLGVVVAHDCTSSLSSS